jgi:glycerol-3-phosphate dehydrogenase (NAD(P)+)
MTNTKGTLSVGIVGGGAFGLGLAKAAERVGNDVLIHSRRSAALPRSERISATRQLGDLGACDLIIVAVPSTHVREVARELGHHLDGRHLVVHVSRGLVGDELRTVTQVLREETPARRLGCLAGPLHARALLEGTPGGGIVGSMFPEVGEAMRAAIAGPSMRLYQTEDVIGVELASALVGLLALALGYTQQIGFGPGALSVMMTRGLAEAARLGVSFGAEERTFSGMAGVGDLMSAAFGDERPEVKLGRALGRGATMEQAGKEANATIEGVAIARRMQRHSARRALETPITDVLAEILEGELGPQDALARLMARRVHRE